MARGSKTKDFRGVNPALIVVALDAIFFLSCSAPDKPIDRTRLIGTALRLCHQIPDAGCREKSVTPVGVPLPPDARLRYLRAESRVDLTISLIRQLWLAGRHDDSRAETQRLIAWSREHRCPEDSTGEMMRNQVINALRGPGTTSLARELVRARAVENPGYAATGLGAEETFAHLVATSSIDEALAFVEPLPDSTRIQVISRAFGRLPGDAPLDSIVALMHRLPPGVVDGTGYYSLSLQAARTGRLDLAVATADSVPDADYYKGDILAFVALELARAGRTSEATRLATRAFDWNARQNPQKVRGLAHYGYTSAGAALLLAGATEELARRRPDIPDVSWRQVLMERASQSAAAGRIDEALADIELAQTLPVFFDQGNRLDNGVVEWIGAQADSGHDAAAVRALDRLHERSLRGYGWSEIAKARARRGDIAGAIAAADSSTRFPMGLGEAIAALCVAQAAAGDPEGSLNRLEEASARLAAMCRYVPERPPVTIIFNMRRQALRGIGAAIHTRSELDRVLARREPLEKATILLGAIEAGSN